MPYSVRCKACSSAFAIPDEIWDKRVRGRIATLKCRACKAEIHVDGTKAGVVQLSVAPPAMKSDEGACAPNAAHEAPTAPIQQEPQQVSAETVSAPAASAQRIDSAPEASPASATTPETGSAGTSRAGAAALAAKPPLAATVLSPKPSAKAAQEVAAAESGWSLMPPPGDIETLGKASSVHAQATVPSSAGTTPAARAVASPAAQPSPPSAPPAPSPSAPDTNEEPPIDPDLWVVSFGDDDDRELKEKEIADELTKGTITLSTIVWQEGMPEWLPISGVKKLAKYAPQPKSAPRQSRLGTANKASPQTSKTPVAKASTASPSLSTTRADSPAARQVMTPRAKQQSQSQLGQAPHPAAGSAPSSPKPSEPARDVVSEIGSKTPSPANRNPEKAVDERAQMKPALPASKTPQRSAASAKADKSAPVDTATTISVPARPPVLVRRGNVSLELGAHDTKPDTSDEVLTSAPEVAATHRDDTQLQVAKQPARPPALPDSRAARFPAADPSSASAQDSTQRSSPKQSFRPPKPVETATSLVTRTEGAESKELLITDEDFLAMQRRFPKWALPVGIVGTLAVVGGLVYAANSGPELPALPVAPVVDTSNELRENPASRAQPKHPQPNLDAPLPTANAAVAGQEKDFAKLFAQSALKSNGTFDTKTAERAAMNFMELAARCRVAPDPSGQARVVITFSTAGQVLSVQVGSPYADTATGRCIEKALRNIKTKAFQGEPGRLPLTVPVH
jgi:hypothetical protein